MASLLRQFVQGLYLAAIFGAAIFAGETVVPGTVSGLAFTPIAVLSLFSMMVLESVYSLR